MLTVLLVLKHLWRRFKTLFQRRIQIQIIARDVCRLTVEEFRSQPDMVKLATGVLNNPEARLMLDVLRNRHLGRMTAVGTMEQRAYHLCRCEGYRLALDDWESLGLMEKPAEHIEATFESPDQQE